MKKILIVLTFLLICISAQSQIHKIIYGDTIYMKSFKSEWVLKDSIENGEWQVFFDENYTQRAILVIYVNNKKEGKYLEWDRKGRIAWDIDYKDGMNDGLKIGYYYVKEYRGVIISLWKDDIQQKDIYMD